MTKKEFVREKLELLKRIGITSIDDLICIVNFMPGGDEPYDSGSRHVNKVFCIEEDTDVSLEIKVKDFLHRLGTPANIIGYQFVTDAIIMAIKDRKVLEGITKVLEPEVAKKNNSTPSRVERAIRHAIEVTWDRGNLDVLEEVFGNTVNPSKGKPTVGEFIALVSDHIRLGKNK